MEPAFACASWCTLSSGLCSGLLKMRAHRMLGQHDRTYLRIHQTIKVFRRIFSIHGHSETTRPTRTLCTLLQDDVDGPKAIQPSPAEGRSTSATGAIAPRASNGTRSVNTGCSDSKAVTSASFSGRHACLRVDQRRNAPDGHSPVSTLRAICLDL